MTNAELSRYYYISNEVEYIRRKIEAECKSENKRKLQEIMEQRQKAAERELVRLEKYIASINDPLIRQIMDYRHVEKMSWRRVARKIGGNNTENGVRKLHDRYISAK